MIQELSSKKGETENGESASYGRKSSYAELNLSRQMAKNQKNALDLLYPIRKTCSETSEKRNCRYSSAN